MPISQTVRQELHQRWKGPPSPYREALARVREEIENHVLAKRYVTTDQIDGRVSGRIKWITHIIEKVDRHQPIDINTIEELEARVVDIVGARVTVDYLDQAQSIKDWIVNHNAWAILKVESARRDNGYRAIHVDLIISTTNFPKGVRCELQIRSLLQDAWAIWTHPLYEKYSRRMQTVPQSKEELMRQLGDMLHAVDEMAQTLR